jgi:hypothetical protein
MKKRVKPQKGSKSPRQSRQDAPGTHAGNARGLEHPPRRESFVRQLALVLKQVEKRMTNLVKSEPWEKLDGSDMRSTAQTALSRLTWLRSFLRESIEREAHIALIAFRIGRDWMRTEMLPWARLGARVSHKVPDREILKLNALLGSTAAMHMLESLDLDLEKRRNRILAFQDVKYKNPHWRDMEIAKQASAELYGHERTWKTILETCREFDKKHLARPLLGTRTDLIEKSRLRKPSR